MILKAGCKRDSRKSASTRRTCLPVLAVFAASAVVIDLPSNGSEEVRA